MCTLQTILCTRLVFSNFAIGIKKAYRTHQEGIKCYGPRARCAKGASILAPHCRWIHILLFFANNTTIILRIFCGKYTSFSPHSKKRGATCCCTSFLLVVIVKLLTLPRYSNPRGGPRDRRHREGVFLRFAIVKSHRLFTSPLRSRHLRRYHYWSYRCSAGRRWDCLGSLGRGSGGRPAAGRCTYPGWRPAKRR